MASRSYLITGGAGFLGSALVKALASAGHRVTVLDDESRGSAGRLRGVAGDVTFVRGDVRDPDAVSRATRRMDCVCHLAAVNGTRHFYERPETVLDVAVRGTLNVLDACVSQGVPDVLLVSSSEVYQTPPAVPTDETVPLSIPDPLNPRYSYAGGKLIGELMVLNYGLRHFRRAVVVRPHNVYGPDMGYDHVIPQLVTRAVRRAAEVAQDPVDLEIQGDGTETRAFVHVDDFTAGLLAVLEKGEHRTIYHVGSEEEVRISDLVATIGRCLGRSFNLVPGPRPEGATLRRCPDIGRVKALGYAPRVRLSDGIGPVVDWYVLHPIPGEAS